MLFLVWSMFPHSCLMAAIDVPQTYPPPCNLVGPLLTVAEDQETL